MQYVLRYIGGKAVRDIPFGDVCISWSPVRKRHELGDIIPREGMAYITTQSARNRCEYGVNPSYPPWFTSDTACPAAALEKVFDYLRLEFGLGPRVLETLRNTWIVVSV
jgi:hypothetical protein